MKPLFFLVGLFTLALAACAPTPGPTIDTPSIPIAKTNAEIRGRLGTYVTIQGVIDTRRSLIGDELSKYTEPQGNVTEAVENALSDSLRERGVSVTNDAPVKIKAEIRSWKSEIVVSASPTLTSDASLYVEMFDASGGRLYSGSYNGTRSSQFPIVTRQDMKDSLGLAMSSAIEQLLADEQLLNHIGGY